MNNNIKSALTRDKIIIYVNLLTFIITLTRLALVKTYSVCSTGHSRVELCLGEASGCPT